MEHIHTLGKYKGVLLVKLVIMPLDQAGFGLSKMIIRHAFKTVIFLMTFTYK